jgi:hypothetical protein
MIAAGLFAVGIAFDTVMPLFVPSCWSFAS